MGLIFKRFSPLLLMAASVVLLACNTGAEDRGSDASAPQQLPRREVTFNVRVPNNTPGGEQT
jgi:hypothetical protein